MSTTMRQMLEAGVHFGHQTRFWNPKMAPYIFGARSKAGKTTQLVDLVASLATATPWLGTLPVSKPRKALFITGESSYKAISKRIYRACHSRGYGLADVRGKFRVEAVEFPQLPNAAHRASISETVAKYGMEVVIIDPLYRGLGGLDTARVNETGQAIVEFAQACQPASLISRTIASRRRPASTASPSHLRT